MVYHGGRDHFLRRLVPCVDDSMKKKVPLRPLLALSSRLCPSNSETLFNTSSLNVPVQPIWTHRCLRTGGARALSLSLYDFSFNPEIFVNLRWTFSSNSWSSTMFGDHARVAYSRGGLTIALYGSKNTLGSWNQRPFVAGMPLGLLCGRYQLGWGFERFMQDYAQISKLRCSFLPLAIQLRQLPWRWGAGGK